MKLNVPFLALCGIAITTLLFGQSSAEEIKRLKEQLKACEEESRQAEAVARNAGQGETRIQYLVRAKAMSLKSQELSVDVELQALVAQQAYIFNRDRHGYLFDNDIYNGLYFALKNNGHSITSSLAGHDYGAARSLKTDTKRGIIYSGGSDGKLIEWRHNGSDWQAKVLIGSRHDYQIYSIDLGRDGQLLVAGGLYAPNAGRNFVELFDLQNPDIKPQRITGFVQSVDDICFLPDGSGFYARDNSGLSIKYSDLTSAREVIKPPAKINSLAISPDGKMLAGAGEDGMLYQWSISQGDSVTLLERVARSNAPLTAVAFSPKGELLITGDNRGLIRIYKGSAFLRLLTGHEGPIENIQFDHQGQVLATAARDKTVRMWQMSSLTEPPIVLRDNRDWIWSMAFSPDDNQIMIGVHSSQQVVHQNTIKTVESIRIYPTKIELMADILCGQYIQRNMSKEEWETYAGSLAYESTCKNDPPGK